MNRSFTLGTTLLCKGYVQRHGTLRSGNADVKCRQLSRDLNERSRLLVCKFPTVLRAKTARQQIFIISYVAKILITYHALSKQPETPNPDRWVTTQRKKKMGGGHFGEQNLAKLQRANSRGP